MVKFLGWEGGLGGAPEPKAPGEGSWEPPGGKLKRAPGGKF